MKPIGESLLMYTKKPWQKKPVIRVRLKENNTYLDCSTHGELKRLTKALDGDGIQWKRVFHETAGDMSKEDKPLSPDDTEGILGIGNFLITLKISGTHRILPLKFVGSNYVVFKIGQNWLLL